MAMAVDPDKYHDEYREELLDLLERKAAGKEVVERAERGAEADQGAGPDGGARGEPRRRQGRGGSHGRQGIEGEA